MSEDGKTSIEVNNEVVSAAEVKALKKRIRQSEHVLGTRHWKWKSLKELFALAAKKTHLAAALVRRRGFPVKRVTDAWRCPAPTPMSVAAARGLVRNDTAKRKTHSFYR